MASSSFLPLGPRVPTLSVDLTNCDREPIHIPGAIQPHGALIACRHPELVVAYVSENLGDLLGIAGRSALGRNVQSFFKPESGAALGLIAKSMRPRDESPCRLVAANGRPFDAVFHFATSDTFVIELEPPSGDVTYHPRLRRSIARLQATRQLDDLGRVAAEEVRALTGFDRVMIYRFDAEWNGEVVAESKRDDLESFLGLHYPASDIPVQARRLYTINWLRFIGDVDYQPVPLIAAASAEPLDMSFCILRSVSPIHCEYLRNMGVTASMSISLLRDDHLWGLVACHHYCGPRVVPYTVRESSEFLGQALSWHIATRLHQHATERKFHAKEIEGELLRSMSGEGGLRDALTIPALLRLTDAHGAAVLVEGELSRLGATPEPAEIRRLAEWLRMQMTDDVFVSDRLPSQWPMAAEVEAVASGVLAVALSRELGDFVIWFRPSAELVVDWAGEPMKQVTDDQGIPRLSPRGSFALWKEIVHGRSDPWHPWQLAAAADLRGAVLHLVQRRAAELLALNDKLVAADRAKDMFLAAVSHELRTPLQAILGWVTRIQEKGIDGTNGARALEIIAKNARIQSQLVDDLLDVARMVGGKLSIAAHEVDLRQVVQNALDTVSLLVEQSGVALEVDLADAAVVFGDAQRLQQVVWNLLTNALKFTPREGRVTVRLSRETEAVVLEVSDSGRGLTPESIERLFEAFWQVPEHGRRAQQGLGLGLAITRHIVDLHGGTIAVESAGLGKGATFRVRLPRLR